MIKILFRVSTYLYIYVDISLSEMIRNHSMNFHLSICMSSVFYPFIKYELWGESRYDV